MSSLWKWTEKLLVTITLTVTWIVKLHLHPPQFMGLSWLHVASWLRRGGVNSREQGQSETRRWSLIWGLGLWTRRDQWPEKRVRIRLCSANASERAVGRHLQAVLPWDTNSRSRCISVQTFLFCLCWNWSSNWTLLLYLEAACRITCVF